MAKQRKRRDQSFEERLARSLERWPAENLVNGFPDAPTMGRLIDASGLIWVHCQPLDDAAARKLAMTADEMIIGDGPYQVVVPPTDRQSTWASVEKIGRLPGEEPDDYLEYRAHEFDSESGRRLLFLQRFC